MLTMILKDYKLMKITYKIYTLKFYYGNVKTEIMEKIALEN